jgi:predicted enzyme related to lactoylglutathione lyase
MTSNPVVWFEIYVQDMPRARKFYEAVLDVKLEKMSIGEHGFIALARDTEGNTIGFHSM